MAYIKLEIERIIIMKLPELTATQMWCCGLGCGECKPKKILFEYSRTEFDNGEVHSKYTPEFVSSCCGAELFLWDESIKDDVPYELVE
jgi:hypothetical protein